VSAPVDDAVPGTRGFIMFDADVSIMEVRHDETGERIK